MSMKSRVERKGSAVVAWLASPRHAYEDRFRLLTKEIPLVRDSGRGEIVAVFDGIGSAPRGMSAAQEMTDRLLAFYRRANEIPALPERLCQMLYEANVTIHEWGYMLGSNRPLGGCAGTVSWFSESLLTVFHAGDTVGMLLREGQMPRVLTRSHEEQGALSRYFGLGEGLQIDVAKVAVREGDLVLLVSDGVTKAFHPHEAADVVSGVFWKTGDISRAAEELAVRSRTHGSMDDITVLIMEVEVQ